MSPRILNITPATGWWVVEPQKGGSYTRAAVVAWAAVEVDEDNTAVVAMIPGFAIGLEFPTEEGFLVQDGTFEDCERRDECRAAHHPANDDPGFCRSCFGLRERPS